MSSHEFRQWVQSKVTHEFIPVKCPNKNAFIESFFSIYELEFLRVQYFASFVEAYKKTVWFIEHYNKRRLHGSINKLPPVEFKQKFSEGEYQDKIIYA